MTAFVCPLCGARNEHPVSLEQGYCVRCGTETGQFAGVVTARCPGCDRLPAYVLDGGRQAFCGNEDSCMTIMWNMWLTPPS